MFFSADALAWMLAEQVAKELHHAIGARGKASLVVSGGSTPKPFFTYLKTHDLPWDKLWVTLADERWVDAASPDSNEKLVREYLWVDGMHLVGLKNDAARVADGVAACERALGAMPHPFDVVILGMGDDGHTASLFPHMQNIDAALDPENPARCMAVMDAPKPPPARMTLTASALLDSRRVVVHITGDKKRAVLDEALKLGSSRELPIRAMLHQEKTPVDVYWAP
ncbi:MAG: 6-phosphogluconolactonase [Alphaproteobacteria bacterium]|nr:6-phosphogluconolactonase [Alphaproteobacteria bacterium]